MSMKNSMYGAAERVEAENKRVEALAFAKAMSEQKLHDPSGNTSRRASRTNTMYTRKNIEEWLLSPTANEKNLRNASIYMYQVNQRYRNLVHYQANIYCWLYTITPAVFNREKAKPETVKKQYSKACNIIETMNVVRTMREATVIAVREGAFYGVIWGGDGKSFILQKLDPDNCQIVSISDGNVFQFTYDMSKVKEADLDTYYPPEFTNMFREYQSSGNQYQIVPAEIAVCLKGDPTEPALSIPLFAGLLPSLFTLKNIEALDETSTELSNYKLLSAKIPLDEEGVPVLDYEVSMQYYNHLANNVGKRVGVAMSPFDIKEHKFDQSGATTQTDTVARANANFFASAGTTAYLHGAANTTSGVTKLAIKVDESYAETLLLQCQNVINRYLKLMPGTIKFKLTFLPVTIYNREEMTDHYKNAMNYGFGKLQYAACIGMAQHDIEGQAYIENEVLKLDELFVPMKTASTRSADEASAGRPQSDDVTEEGDNTRDSDANDNR